MFGSAMIEVAIGLVFTYLLMSLICSAINEMIEAKLKNRATDLEKGIRELFMEPEVKGSGEEDEKGMVQKLYEHPLICGLFGGGFSGKLITKSSYWRSTNLPSYIPNRNFAVALIDIVMSPPGTTPSSSPVTIDSLRAAVGKIQNNDTVKRALSNFLATAGDDINRVRESIEAWFNSSMDRVTGWYKRRTQWILLVLGLVLSILLNVNTFTIAEKLWIDPSLRSLVVTQATDQSQAKTNSGDGAGQTVKANIDSLEKLGLPIGWPNGLVGTYGLDKKSEPSKVAYEILLALFGWLFTAAAISFGAPFWFDLLGKFLTVRSTMKPQEKAPAETPPDNRTPAPSPSGKGTSTSSDSVAVVPESLLPCEWAKGDPQEGII